MRLANAAAALSLATAVTWLVMPVAGQDRKAATMHQSSLPQVNSAGKTDWPLHNLDVRNSRYSSLNEINTSNVSRLTPKWSFPTTTPDSIGSITPLVVDGVMYIDAGSKLFAVNAVTGESVWTFQTEPAFTGRSRGPAYGDGRVYAHGASVLYAVDAKTGKLVESFGEKGLLPLVSKALAFKYPGKHHPDLDPISLGYDMSSPPAYFDGTLFVGLADSDSFIPGGLLVAADGTTGAIKWVFNTVPQGPQDDGWEIAKNTWAGGPRVGGGIWTQPAIDPELGMIYFNATNPTPDYDGSARRGANLFTDSTIALNLATGKLVWYNQAVHHDLWDRDLASGPVLFDVTVGGRNVKGIGAVGKTCYLYIWNRETGQPINPIVETAVPTTTDVPGEEVWPTQPIPYTAAGVPQQPFCATYPIVADPELAKRARQNFHPFLVHDFVTISPGLTGGANYGSSSFSPRTRLLYVTGKNDAYSIKVKAVGDTLKPSRFGGHYGVIASSGQTGMTPSTAVAAYNPATGQLAWQTRFPGTTSAGNFVSAGDIVFQGGGTGDFYALDARSGRQLFTFTAKGGIRASPLTYQVNGRQYITVVAMDTVLTFGLPY